MWGGGREICDWVSTQGHQAVAILLHTLYKVPSTAQTPSHCTMLGQHSSVFDSSSDHDDLTEGKHYKRLITDGRYLICD